MNLDTISWAVTQPNTGAAMAVVAGDPAQIRNSIRGRDIFMLAAWTHTQAAVGFTQILWPSGHDLMRGIRARNVNANNFGIIPNGFPPAFKPQDPLTVTQSGSNVAGDVQFLTGLFWYEDLPGVDANLINVGMLMKRGLQCLTIEDTCTPTVSTTYSGPRALNAASDLLKADTMYAIVGGSVGVRCACITVRGPDSGNMRFAIQGEPLLKDWTNEQFVRLSERTDLPTIPVFNSANRAGTFVEVLQDENGTAVPWQLNLVELGPAPQAQGGQNK